MLLKSKKCAQFDDHKVFIHTNPLTLVVELNIFLSFFKYVILLKLLFSKDTKKQVLMNNKIKLFFFFS